VDREKLTSSAELRNKLFCPYAFMLYIGNLPFHRKLGCEDTEWIHLVKDMASGGLL
jgi:hypothetical protein